MKLTDISLKRPALSAVIIIALLVMGVINYRNLALESMPDVNPPYVTVSIVQAGASPDQLETKVAKKVEDSVGQISGVKHLTTTISESVSTTAIEFEMDKSSDEAIQEVRDKISLIRDDLPDDINEPIISKYDSTASPVMSLAITSSMNKRELSQIVEDDIKKQLTKVDGVGTINVYGNEEREIQIKLDKNQMAAYNLTTTEVVTALESENLDVPSGSLSDSNGKMTISTDGSVENVSDFNQICVATRNGVSILVKDIGEVVDGTAEQDSLAYYQGKDAISLDIIKQSGGNTVQIAQDIKNMIQSIQQSLPASVEIHVVSDGSISVKNTVNSVVDTLIEGCILAVLIIFLFLGELRITIISAISLPTSIISTFIGLKVMDFSLNMMTLIALSLAVGLLIDDAIVVIENIVRHLHMGKSPLEAAKDGTSEIGLAVTATTMSVVAMFLPMAMVSGMIGKYLIQFGLTIVFSLLISLFVSFTLVPVLAAKFTKTEKRRPNIFRIGFDRCFDGFSKLYTTLLRFVLRHRALTLLAVFAIFVASLSMFTKLSMETVPYQDLNEIDIVADMDSGMTLQLAADKANEMNKLIQDQPEIQYIYSKVTTSEADFLVQLSDKDKRTKTVEDVASDIRKTLQTVTGVNVAVNFNAGEGMTGKEVVYHIEGSDYNQIQSYALKVKQLMKQIPGAVDVSLSNATGSPETKLEIDRDMASELGVSTGSISSTLGTLFSGIVVSQYNSGTDLYDVRLSIQDEQKENIDSLNGIYVPGSNGLVPLDQVTKEVFSTSAATINRYDKQREIQISANLYGVASGDFENTFMSQLKSEIGIPSNIQVVIGGTSGAAGDGMTDLIIALLLGILFIYLILVVQFENFIDPLSILFSLPLAIIGAIWSMYLSKSTISMTAMIGLILLMGLVTKNAILLIDYAKRQRSHVSGREEALVQAGMIRLRPILMTSLAMIFGMIPTALSHEMGSEITSPMGIVIIGGLISSTLLTLFVVPIMYTLFDDLQILLSKLASLFSKKNPNDEKISLQTK